jgi:ubiquinone/menaquinone biosynthesis C-methylase UbiE
MDADLHTFYAQRYAETDRLWATPHGNLERVRTWELLERHLPAPPARVLDVGGGPGVHAAWLAQRGHAVHLLDVVPDHVVEAARLPGVTAGVADARDVPLPDGHADAVLVLGPLYHLLEAADRAAALAEAARVAAPGAPVFAAGIGRYAGLMDYAAEGRLTAATEPLVRAMIDSQRHDPAILGFTHAHLHTPEELAAELSAAGLHDVVVYGVEGPVTNALDAHGMERLDEFLDSAVRGARLVERDPAIIAASAHLLAVGWRSP